MKTITYKEYLRREKNIKELGEQGVVFLFKKNKFKLILGGICLLIAVFPNGLGLIFYPLGFYLLGIGSADLFRFREEIMRKIKNKIKRFGK